MSVYLILLNVGLSTEALEKDGARQTKWDGTFGFC